MPTELPNDFHGTARPNADHADRAAGCLISLALLFWGVPILLIALCGPLALALYCVRALLGQLGF